jgi:hypothetical protein
MLSSAIAEPLAKSKARLKGSNFIRSLLGSDLGLWFYLHLFCGLSRSTYLRLWTETAWRNNEQEYFVVITSPKLLLKFTCHQNAVKNRTLVTDYC